MINNSNCNCGKFKPCAMGLAFGTLWSLSLIFSTILAACCGWGDSFIGLIMDIYPGYDVTFVGGIIGALWALADGFIGGFIFAWVYNFFCGCSKCCCVNCKCGCNDN